MEGANCEALLEVVKSLTNVAGRVSSIEGTNLVANRIAILDELVEDNC